MDEVKEEVLDDGVVAVVRPLMLSVAKLIFEEKESFFCSAGAGVQVVSLLRGVLFSADVSEEDGLLSSIKLAVKNV